MIARSFYAIALMVYGIQQFVYSNFRPVFVPSWQNSLPLLSIWSWLFGLLLFVSGILILANKKIVEISLLVGGVFLFLLLVVQVPYEIISDPYNKHLGSWTSALKELALAGGAFVVADSVRIGNEPVKFRNTIISGLYRIVPLGKLFFSITMIAFGVAHLLYAELIKGLVPSWFHDPLFWTYFAAVCLIGSGISIILNIRMKQVAALLSIMILTWFFILHLPRAIEMPYADRGNELASAFDALAFSGIAFLIAANANPGMNK